MFKVERIDQVYRETIPAICDVRPRIIVLSGVSGTGKTSLCDTITGAHPDVGIVRNFTTRRLRSELNDSKYYLSGSDALFRHHFSRNNILCYLRWPANQHKYALLKSELSRFGSDDTVMYTCTHFGSILKAQNPARVLHIWLTCADQDVLRQRLNTRNSETGAELDRRYHVAVREQDMILQSKEALLIQGKIDHIIETGRQSVSQVADQVLALMQRRCFRTS